MAKKFDRHPVRVDGRQRTALIGRSTNACSIPRPLKYRAALSSSSAEPDFEAKMLGGRHLAAAQHQGVRLPLLDATQIEGSPVGVLDDEAEGVGIEGAATTKVGDSQGDVAAANDVEGWLQGGFWNGHFEAQKPTVSLDRPHSSVRRCGGIFVAGAGVQC